MALLELKSIWARALVPVALGIAVIAGLAGGLWLLAAYMTDNPAQTSTRITADEWTVGATSSMADLVADNGPLLFQEPGSDTATRSIVLDHEGDDPNDGWRVYWAYPADRDADCPVTQSRGEFTFVDCEGRTVTVDQLAPPDENVFPRVDDDATLVIDFRAAATSSS